MNLSEQQKAIVSKWIAEGAALSEVQTRIRSEWGIAITYMEARLLMADLQLTPVEKKVEEAASPVSADNETPIDADEVSAHPEEENFSPSGGNVQVTIDHITKPNALISGKVIFSDAQNAEWSLDSQGRLGLIPSTPGYRPSQPDITAFQMELQRMAKSQGF